MTYDVVFIEEADASAPVSERAVGEHVFLANLPTDPKVFAFYYPGDMDTEEVETRLRALGKRTGDNLFVNIGSLVDPDYQRAVMRFGLGRLPAIIVTAVAPLAATPDGNTTFVRLDSKLLFARPEQLTEAIEQLFNLFLGGKVAQALIVGRWTLPAKAAAAAAAERIWGIIQPIFAWVARMDITVDYAGGKIEIKESGARK